MRSGRQRPPDDHHSFAEHDRIAATIAQRDLPGAAEAMHHHLRAVQKQLIDSKGPAIPPE
uniref:FCD domain-containing protein n=1 Tax=Paracoccus marcusii TaxID=59779 RepID=UPI0037359573